MKQSLSLVLAIALFGGCAAKIEQKPSVSKAKLQKVEWEDIENFSKDNLNEAFDVFKKDCKVSRKDKNLDSVCIKALTSSSIDSKKFFTTNFTPYKLISPKGDDKGLITGYYEPLLYGNRFKTPKYKYPVYATPSDLLVVDLASVYPSLEGKTVRGKLVDGTIKPYPTREEIESMNPQKSRVLKPICYVDDKIDLFFLQVQGSGRVQLPNGRFINLAYGGQNGRKYHSIGKELIKRGYIKKEDISLQSIKKWAKKNPALVDEILNTNQSYVFFQQSEKTATGSLGVELVANRNIAVDTRYIPLGYPVFLETTNPITDKPYEQLMIAADRGGAIKGTIRADIFFGYGLEAKKLAGNMKQQGTMYILLPNTTQEVKDASNK